jgi:hypothetical protein
MATRGYVKQVALCVCVCQGARATAEAQQLPHQVLTAAQAMKRFPGTREEKWDAAAAPANGC